jgi:hypothetical protein
MTLVAVLMAVLPLQQIIISPVVFNGASGWCKKNVKVFYSYFV